MNMDQRTERLRDVLPEPLQTAFFQTLEGFSASVEELRLRRGREASVVCAGRERPLRVGGRTIPSTGALLEEILRRASENSVYAVQEQLCAGFLPLPGGHRLGVCGTVVHDGEGIRSIRGLQAMNLRIAREIPGAADPLRNLLRGSPGSVLILGPPGRGKTTLLRDLIRQISDGLQNHVAVVDERGELAACLDGVPQFSLGRMTDVMSLCSKREGIRLLLRSMGPDWIAVDEITAEEDVDALLRASYCGVRFLATAHAAGREDLTRRPVYRRLTASELFSHLVVIEADRSLRTERMGYESG